MGDLVEQTKGTIKEAAGKVTGDKQMELEGAAQSETAKAGRELKGGAQEVKGKVEEGVGKVTGDRSTQVNGKVDQVTGEVKRSI